MIPDPDAIGALAPLRLGAWRGARDERVAAKLVEAAVSGRQGNDAETLKSDQRSSVVAVATGEYGVVVKEVRKAGARRRNTAAQCPTQGTGGLYYCS